jgi:hypothetical protein
MRLTGIFRGRAGNALAILAVASGCSKRAPSSPHTPLGLASVVGCYQFTWQRHDSTLKGPSIPDLVRLDSTSACPECRANAPAATHLSLGTPLPDTAPWDTAAVSVPWYRLYRASHWLLVRPDTVKVFFNSNWTNWDVTLVPRNGVLGGSARYWSDGGGFNPALATVTSRHIACPS